MAADVAAVFAGLKYIRDFTKWVSEMRQDAEVLSRINEVMRAAGEIQDKLHDLREANLLLLEEKAQLANQLREVEEWHKRRAAYPFVTAPGGAVVLKSNGPPAHYACPNCAESKRELQILQDGRNAAGSYRCPACEGSFNVDEPKPPLDPYRSFRR